MKNKLLVPLLVLISLPSVNAADDSLKRKAQELAHRILIVDTHEDVPYRLWNEKEDISRTTENGNFDYPRAVQGGLNAPFFAIYVPSKMEKTGGGKALADSLIDMVEEVAKLHSDKFAMATSIGDVKRNFKDGIISILLGIENGTALEGDLSNIGHFYSRGVRYITLAHAEDNSICDSSYDTTRTWHGLSPYGRKVVEEMNRVGCMIDISHVTDDAFYQVLELSRAPVIASHSSCRYFTPGWERNMSDEMIKKLAEKGGIIQINFGSGFLRDDIRRKMEATRKEVEKQLKAENLDWGDEKAHEYLMSYRKEHPPGYASVSDVADHIDHVVGLVGIDHVGLGSDFDGLGDSLPESLKDVSGFPNLIYELLRRGYSERDIAKICSGNTLRVWAHIEKVAAKTRSSE